MTINYTLTVSSLSTTPDVDTWTYTQASFSLPLQKLNGVWMAAVSRQSNCLPEMPMKMAEKPSEFGSQPCWQHGRKLPLGPRASCKGWTAMLADHPCDAVGESVHLKIVQMPFFLLYYLCMHSVMAYCL